MAVRIPFFLLVVAPFLGAQQPPPFSGSSSTVRITTEAYSGAQTVTAVTWTSPQSDFLYCMGDQNVQSMRFTCLDCNSTEENQLVQNSEDARGSASFPLLRLKKMSVGKAWHGKTIQCEGTALAGGQTSPLVAQVTVSVQYMTDPVVVNSDGLPPVLSELGQRFYVRREQSLTLVCQVDANPRPSRFAWFVDGAFQNNQQQQSIAVSWQNAGAGVMCKAYQDSPINNERGSGSVKIDLLEPPALVTSNFDSQRQSALENGGSVALTRSVTMDCSFTSMPKATIFWRQGTANQQILNASCSEGVSTVYNSVVQQVPYDPSNSQLGTRPLWLTQSRCTINVADYDQSGTFWCAGCVQTAANQYECVPNKEMINTDPKTSITWRAIGVPMIPRGQDAVNVTFGRNSSYRLSNDDDVAVAIRFCANPDPQPQNSYWTIDGDRLNFGQKKDDGHFEALPLERNMTFEGCYIAALIIRQATLGDVQRVYQLTVANSVRQSMLQATRQVNLRDYTLPNNINPMGVEGEANVGLAVGLAIGVFLVIVLCLVVFMWWRQMVCFGGKKAMQEKIRSNVVPETVRSEPSAKVEVNGDSPEVKYKSGYISMEVSV